jgi:hypothetical protein
VRLNIASALAWLGQPSVSVILSAAAVLVAVLIYLTYARPRDWTGFTTRRIVHGEGGEVIPGKTLWDWLQLLVIPLALTVGAFALNST